MPATPVTSWTTLMPTSESHWVGDVRLVGEHDEWVRQPLEPVAGAQVLTEPQVEPQVGVDAPWRSLMSRTATSPVARSGSRG